MEMLLIDSLDNTFQSEGDCEKFLMKSRWANGFCCPRCDHDSFYKVKTRTLLECKECRTQISITAGTVMHKSKLPLLLWFKAIRLLIQNEMAYTIPAFASLLGVNYRTAKLMLEKLQLALHKQYSRMGNKQQSEEKYVKPKKNTSIFAMFLFKSARNVKYAEQDLFRKWMNAFFSVYLYPQFLRYFQVV